MSAEYQIQRFPIADVSGVIWYIHERQLLTDIRELPRDVAEAEVAGVSLNLRERVGPSDVIST